MLISKQCINCKKKSSAYVISSIYSLTLSINVSIEANSVNLDQTAPKCFLTYSVDFKNDDFCFGCLFKG